MYTKKIQNHLFNKICSIYSANLIFKTGTLKSAICQIIRFFRFLSKNLKNPNLKKQYISLLILFDLT